MSRLPAKPSAPSWSGRRPFVGREGVLEEMSREVDEVVEGSGRALFLLGPAGVGKTALVGAFQELAYRGHRDLEAEYVDCGQSGAETWRQLAVLFTRGQRLRRSARKLTLGWLEAVPLVGDLIVAIIKTVQAVRTGRIEELERRVPRSPEDTAVQAVRSLLEYGPREPRLVIVDSLDRGDSEDLAGAAALVRRLKETRTLFLASVRTSRGKPPDAVHDLILEAERLGVARRIELSGLDIDDLREAVASATRRTVPDEWVKWLAVRTRGVPGDVWSLLGALEEGGRLRKAGRGWEWAEFAQTAGEIQTRPLEKELAFDDRDRRLLALAALEGEVFHSAVLAELAGLSELEVEDHLSRLARSGVIEFRDAPGVGDDVTSQYAFRETLAAEAFAAELSAEERDALGTRAEKARRGLGLSDPASG